MILNIRKNFVSNY